MKRVILSLVALSSIALSKSARAESYIPPSYYRTLYNTNVRWSYERGLLRTQAQIQQLQQQQLQRAQAGRGPTAAMLEQARRLDLIGRHQQQMIDSVGLMVHRGHVDAQRHYWEMLLRRGW